MSDYQKDPNRPATLKLTRDEWINVTMAALELLGEEPLRLALQAAVGTERADKLIVDKEGPRFSKRDNHALVREVYKLIPGATRLDKIDRAIAEAAPCFATEERLLEVVQFCRQRVEEFEAAGGSLDVFPDPPAPTTTLTGEEPGFLWKPVGENSRALRVLLPSAFTGLIDLGSCKLWHGGMMIETLSAIGVGNGNRQHFAGAKPGGAYNSPIQVRVTADDIAWAWDIPTPPNRHENITGHRLGDTTLIVEDDQ